MNIPFRPAKLDPRSLRIRQPCPKRWQDMKGNDQQRFCEHCNLHVHNVSAMSTRQIESLLKTPGRHCVSYLQNQDGAIRTRPSSTWAARIAPGTRRLLASVLALLFPLSFTACNSDEKSFSITAYRIPSEPVEDELTGELAPNSEEDLPSPNPDPDVEIEPHKPDPGLLLWKDPTLDLNPCMPVLGLLRSTSLLPRGNPHE